MFLCFTLDSASEQDMNLYKIEFPQNPNYNINLNQRLKMRKRQRPESLQKCQNRQLNKPETIKDENNNNSSSDEDNHEKDEENQISKMKSNSLSQLLPSKISDFQKYNIKNQKELSVQFFRQDVVELAKALLGKVFVRQTNKGIIKAVIVETEAYKAPLDKACHAYNNKKTQRTKYFWLDGGHLYIYTIYMPSNICLNVVAGNEGQPEAVLIRAVQPIEGIEIVKQFRKIKSPKIQDMTNGPGKVGQALGINMKEMNGSKLTEGEFRIIDGGIQGFSMGVSRRVNIDYAEEWIDMPWRFFVEGNKFVSKVDFKPKKSK